MGGTLSLLSQTFPPKSRFEIIDIPDLKGRVVIITGANTGIGKEIARAILSHNAKVYLAGRSMPKIQEAIRELEERTGRRAYPLKLDLSDLVSVKAASEEFLSKEQELHILFNNAGVMVPPTDLVSAQGYDLQFATNVLGHFYFTRLLMPALLQATKGSPDNHARVVNTSSSVAYFASGNLDFNVLLDGPTRRATKASTLYAYSKFGTVLFANELARRYEGQGVVSTSCNPGNIKTDMQRHLNFFQKTIRKPIQFPPSYGALTPLWAGTSPEGTQLNGQFLIPWARRASYPPIGFDNEKLAKDLWEWCEEQCARIP